MVILNIKDVTDIFNEIVTQTRDGIVTIEREKIVYSSATDNYRLEGAGSGSISIHSIQSVEGISNDGFYRHPTEDFNGIEMWEEDTDFALSGSSGTVAPASAGVIAGDTLYDFFVWQGDNKPKEGSTFLVSYTYYDLNKTINPARPTSFAAGGIATAMANAFANVVGNMYNELQNSHDQQFIQSSTGDDLNLHMENYGLERRSATPSTGLVSVTNNTGDDIELTSAFRFTTGAFSPKIFIPQESKTIGAGNTEHISVESSETGFTQNVGIGAIIKMYEDVELSSQVQNVVVTNAGTVAGATNLFNDGSNEESNAEAIERLLNTINKRGNATKIAIASAITNLSSVRQAKIFDWEDKKTIAPPNFQVFVVGQTDKIIKDSQTLSEIGLEVREIKPVGTQFTTITPMGIYVNVSGTAYIDRQYYSERTSLQSQMSTSITQYMNDRGVGADVVTSRIIEEGMGISNIRKFTVDEKIFSEYAFKPFDQSSTWLVYASGTDDPYAQEFLKLSKGFNDVFQYFGVDTFTMSGTQISGGFVPTVYIAVQDQNGIYVRDPQYAINWYLSNTVTDITIDDQAGSGAGVFLVSGTTFLLFDYESYEQHDIDGIRVLLSGTVGTGDPTIDVEVSIWSGASEPTTKIDGVSINIVSGTNEYDVFLASTYTFDIDTARHWLVISGTEAEITLSGASVSIPLESAGRVAFGSPSVKWYSGTTWEAITDVDRYMETVTLLKSTDYSDIDISNLAQKSEIAILNDLNITMRTWEGDET